MKIIKKLSDMIKEEIADAEKYANCALNYKDGNKSLADTFYTLANEELKHMGMLHEQVENQIKVFKAQGYVVPERMQAIYDYVHEEQIEAVNKVRIMLALYKG